MLDLWASLLSKLSPIDKVLLYVFVLLIRTEQSSCPSTNKYLRSTDQQMQGYRERSRGFSTT